MKGVLYVEWDHDAVPPRPRYFGYGEIDGTRVSLHGEIDDNNGIRRVRLVVRERAPNVPRETVSPVKQTQS